MFQGLGHLQALACLQPHSAFRRQDAQTQSMKSSGYWHHGRRGARSSVVTVAVNACVPLPRQLYTEPYGPNSWKQESSYEAVGRHEPGDE